MVDISRVHGVINQQTSLGGHHLVPSGVIKRGLLENMEHRPLMDDFHMDDPQKITLDDTGYGKFPDS